MNMNRLFSIILIALLVLVAFAVTACEEEPQVFEHVHDFKDKEVKPTCTKEGYVEYTCQICGYSYRDTFTDKNPDNHSYAAYSTVPATCENHGYTSYKCTSCGAIKYDDFTSAPNHSFGEWNLVFTPECANKGVEERFCENCGRREERLVDGHPHVITEVKVVAPTELTCGYTIHYCSCGRYYYKEEFVNPIGSEVLEFRHREVYNSKKELIDEYYEVVGFSGEAVANVVIPEDYNGLPVKNVSALAFFNEDKVVSITLTNNITMLSSSAFSYCSNFTTFYFLGTEEEWDAINKEDNWAHDLGEYEVVFQPDAE